MANHVPWNAVINLGNSIIGVSILAYPWCFRECGLALGIFLLLCGGYLTKATCYLLLRSSKVSRRHSYEFLAQHTLGTAGKMAVEFCIIGLLVGTCIAFFVIIGDLAPSIVSKWLGLENSWHLRCCILILVAVFIILPLGMKRNVESLGSLSMLSIIFYLLFTADIIVNSLPSLLSLKWLNDVELWRLPGVLKGISIFSMSLCCQTILFAVYDSLQEKTVKLMEGVVSKSVNMVTMIYILVGFFGYICYYQAGIKGDILLNFPPSLLSEILRLGFTVSVALSFPLCIFPCRASIYTLFCHSTHSVENPHGGGDFIPPAQFKLITVMIVSATLIVGITVPHVETILGLTGATLGSLIGFIIPAIIYIRTTGVPNKNYAKIILVIGMLLLVCSTYDNLSTTTKSEAEIVIEDHIKLPELVPVEPDKVPVKPDDNVGVKPDDDVIKEGKPGDLVPDEKQDDEEKKAVVGGQEEKPDEQKEVEVVNEKRQEPPVPHAPDSKEDTAGGDKPVAVEDAKKEEEKKEIEDVKVDAEEIKKAAGGDDDDGDVGAADFEAEDVKKEVKKEADVAFLEKENEKKQKELQEKEKELKDKEENLDKLVEDKFAEQEQKQEEQQKKLEELEVRQHEQEKIIEAQAEVIKDLKDQHQQEQLLDAVKGEVQMDGQMDGQMGGQMGGQVGGQMAGGNLQQPVVGDQQQANLIIPQLPAVQGGLPQQQQQQQQQGFVPQQQAAVQQQGVPQVPVQQQVVQDGIQQDMVGQPVVRPGVAGQPVVRPGVAGQPLGPQGVAGQPVVQQGMAGQPGIQLQPVLQPGGILGEGVAPQGVPLQQDVQQQPIDMRDLGVNNEVHVVRREAPFNPQLQQQNADLGQPQQQFQQQMQQQQQPLFQQQVQLPVQQQQSNKLPQQQQQQLNIPNNQLNMVAQQPVQQNIQAAQQLQQLNMPGPQVPGDAVLMQGAVAQQRQLLQGDSQVPPLPGEQAAHDRQAEALNRGKEQDVGQQNTKQVDEMVHKDHKVQETKREEKSIVLDDNQRQKNTEQQVPKEEKVEENNQGQVPVKEQVQENKSDHKVPHGDKMVKKHKDDAPSLEAGDKDKKSKSQGVDVNTDEKEAAEEERKEDTGDTVKRQDKEDDHRDEGGVQEDKKEVDAHEVKFKTRQEMAIKATKRTIRVSDDKVNQALPNSEADSNVKSTGRLVYKQIPNLEENSKKLNQLSNEKAKHKEKDSDDFI